MHVSPVQAMAWLVTLIIICVKWYWLMFWNSSTANAAWNHIEQLITSLADHGLSEDQIKVHIFVDCKLAWATAFWLITLNILVVAYNYNCLYSFYYRTWWSCAMPKVPSSSRCTPMLARTWTSSVSSSCPCHLPTPPCCESFHTPASLFLWNNLSILCKTHRCCASLTVHFSEIVYISNVLLFHS